MEEVYSWIRNIVIYMIINTIIMNLLGNKSYKKYVSIVSGMILVLIVISPLIKLMKLDENLDYYLQANDFAVEASDFKNDVTSMQKEELTTIFKDYREKIRTRVENLLLEDGVSLDGFDITFDQNATSPTLGEILSMNITGSMKEEKKESKEGNLSIDTIDIDDITFEEDSDKEDQKLPSPLEQELKKQLSDFYDLEQENITINIQGG